jgi:CHASE1-domain containing sensor protein
VVLDKDRVAFEKLQRAEGVANFTITELDMNNQLTPAQKRTYYVSAMYVEPLPYAQKLSGFDSSNEKQQQAILEAKNVGELMITMLENPFWQTNEQENTTIVAYAPVYEKGSLDEAPEQQNKHNILWLLYGRF